MTHPDPYIEEVMNNYDKEAWYANEEGLNGTLVTGKQMPELKSFFLDILKTQRIKDIEEIEVVLRKNKSLFVDAYDFKIMCEFLTSRKAAIEEV